MLKTFILWKFIFGEDRPFKVNIYIKSHLSFCLFVPSIKMQEFQD